MQFTDYYILILLILPIVGGVVSFQLKKEVSLKWNASVILVALLAAVGLLIMVHDEPYITSWKWADEYFLQIRIDRIAAILILLVYFIAFLVFLFSVSYMMGEPGIRRYGLKLSFFTSSMIGLLIADSFILLFLFWELVGFSSYLLISYWFQDKEKAKSAKESFMINRVADAFLLVGLLLLMITGQQHLSTLNQPINFWTGIFLMLGAFGKSAQLPFSGWLPKAMAGPTPVSALIHAATMVTAGVYLLIRLSPVLPESLRLVIAVSGAVTAFYAAYAALAQYDIKGVLAYSTISQLGFMMIAIGVGSPTSAAFHLWTHAFFKAGLFLSAGSVITYMHHVFGHQYDPQDMRNMGGLKRFLPVTFIVHVICGLALSGIPLFSGFMSKGGILSGSVDWALTYGGMGIYWAYLVPALALMTVFLTPVYMFRQLFLIYDNQPKLPIWITGFKQSNFVKIPLILLAALSIWIFAGPNPVSAESWWLKDYAFQAFTSLDMKSSTVILTEIISFVLAGLGALLAYFIYGRGIVLLENHRQNFFAQFSHKGWYLSYGYFFLSEAYVRACKTLAYIDNKVIDHSVDLSAVSIVMFSKSMGWIDRFVVDGIVDFSAKFASLTGRILSRLQSRGLQTQILYLLVIFIAIVSWVLLS